MMQKEKIINRIATACNIMTYSGVAILIASLIYMIVNVAKADLIVRSWIPFMMGGVFIIFFSLLIKRISVR